MLTNVSMCSLIRVVKPTGYGAAHGRQTRPAPRRRADVPRRLRRRRAHGRPRAGRARAGRRRLLVRARRGADRRQGPDRPAARRGARAVRRLASARPRDRLLAGGARRGGPRGGGGGDGPAADADDARLMDPAVVGPSATRVLRAIGMPEDDAALTADCLLAAELRGMPGHGILRLLQYADSVAAGDVRAPPPGRGLRPGGAGALVDARGGLGHAPPQPAR